MTKDLIPTKITAVQLFSENGLDPVLNKIKSEIDKFKPDVETSKGRKEIAAFARKIASSKVFIEKSGKELVSGIKAKAKLIDAERRRSRETLDIWRDEVRKPLTDYEEIEKAKIEARRQKELFNLDYEEAIAENSIFDREREIAKKEAEFERISAEKRQKEETERLERERKEREERIKKEAIEQAEAAIEQAKQEKIEAEEKAERDRIAAKKQAEIDKQVAIQMAKDEAERNAKLEKEKEERRAAEIKAIAEKKATNKKHQATVNNEILLALGKLGVEETLAKKIIIKVAKGEIPFVSINY